jgi:phage gp46-like protein
MTSSPVPDVRLVQNTAFPRYSVTIDWQLLDDGTLDDTQALATAIIVALGTNALADPTEELPDPDSTDRGGWWGDLEADTIWNAWPIGGKLWLLRRSAIESVNSRQGSTVARVLAYVKLALQPFVDQKIASRFVASAARVDTQRIDTRIVIYRGPTPAIQLLYSVLWDEQQAATQTAHN